MTHLRIELNNIQENVSSAVIKKLYELATSGDLDASSNLAGNLYVSATYLEYIDALCKTLLNPNGLFEDLTITAGGVYIMFADPEVERLLKSAIGDGVGVTLAQAANATLSLLLVFAGNTTITLFDELRFFTGITTNPSFSGCTNLEHIQIPNTVRTIDPYSFRNCRNLVSAGDLSNVTSLDMNLSYNMNSFTVDPSQLNNLVGELDLSLGSPVVEANASFTLNAPGVTGVVFSGFAGSSITINSPITYFSCGWAANLTTLSIPSSVTNLYLDNCTNLTNFNYDLSNLTTISAAAFRRTPITRVEWPSTITTIDSNTFVDCPNLTYVHIPSTVTTIGNYAFTGGYTDKHIKIDEGVTSIGDRSFNANRLILPSTITSIGSLAYCPNTLEFIAIKATTPPTYPSDCFYSNFNYTIYVPDASVAAYKAQPGGNGGNTAWIDRVKSFTDFANDYPGISLNGTGYATDPI